MAVFQVTNTFVINTRARSADVNQNFTDVLATFAADHHNPGVYSNAQPITTSGIAPNAQIMDTQLKIPFTRANMITSPGVITAAAIAGLIQTKFGGTGADGALTVTSGTTTIDCGGAQYFVKNYTSISITGTGAVQFTNPHANGTTIVIKCSGNVTLTSSATPMFDASGMGALGGTGGSVSSSSSSTNPGNPGNAGYGFGIFQTNPGLGATSSAGTDGGVPSGILVQAFLYNSMVAAYKYGMNLWLGAGGGGGSAYNNSGGTHALTGGQGGRGGGCLIIECYGAWNFTTANGISVAGKIGSAATGTGGTLFAAGGGGGGAAGLFIALYNTLTANSGSVTVTGGGTGANTAGTGNFAIGGGAANLTAGSVGVGATGVSLVTLNSEYT